jgi:hypothetical protein
MGILDDAIREHLDLKRKHGARDSEISEIEDEAFGSGDRPDPFAAGELFREVSSTAPEAPEGGTGPATPPPAGLEEPPPAEEPTALIEPQKPPEPPSAPPEPSSPEPPPAAPPEPSFPEPPSSAPSKPSFPEPPDRAPAEKPPAPQPPADSESLEELMAEEEEESEPAEDIVIPPPPPEPPPPPPAATEGQRGRALGRADVPTQEHRPPPTETGEAAPVPPEPEPAEDAGPQLYDFETDPELVAGEAVDPGVAPPPREESDDFEALGPVEEDTGDHLYLDEEEPNAEEGGGVAEAEVAEDVEERHDTEVRPAEPGKQDDDDLLSESPEFLEQDTDSEGLWFEKGPPQDFDFEDEEEEED